MRKMMKAFQTRTKNKIMNNNMLKKKLKMKRKIQSKANKKKILKLSFS